METNEDLVVRVYGYDLGVLRRLSQEVRQTISGISGIVDARTEIQIEEPQVEIEVDLASAELHQIKPGEVRRAASTLLSGIQVGNLYEEQKVFDVVVWGVPEIRNSLTDIRELRIDTPGGQVPLADLADVRIVPAPISIKRDAVSRFIDVEAEISGRNLGAVVADVRDRLGKVEFPLEYNAEVLSASGQKQETRQRMFAVVVASAIGILLLMQASFASFRFAFVVFLTLPLALSGGVLAAFISGRILSLGSLIGFLSLMGIAVRNGIVLISHFHHLEEFAGESFGLQLILRGARERMAPIMMTAGSAGLALLPIVFAGDIAGSEIVHPMAVVILGGLVTSTYFSLFIVPTLYIRFGSINTNTATV